MLQKLDLRLLCQKHEVFVIVLRDDFEQNPQELGNVNLIDPANGLNYEGELVNAPLENFKKHIKKMTINFMNTYKSVVFDFVKILRQ